MFSSELVIEDGKSLYEAILPEKEDLISNRASVKFKLDGDKIIFNIEAQDFASFRAMEAAMMRLLVTFYKMKNLEA